MDASRWWQAASDAVMVVDRDLAVVAWNEALTQLLGHPGAGADADARALGRRCYDVLQGRDVFGNRYCSPECPVTRLRDHSEPIRPFQLLVAGAAGGHVQVDCQVFVLKGDGSDYPLMAYVMRTADRTPPTLASTAAVAGTGPGCGGQAAQGAPAGPVAAGEPRRTSADGEPSPAGPDGEPSPLTPRETELLQILAKGMSTRETARILSISPVTVRNHVANILRKLAVSSRLAAVALARETGLIE